MKTTKSLPFHPTISISSFLSCLIRSFASPRSPQYLKELFPGQTVCLTDSGRSALALVFEHLHLKGKRLALPAYVCDALLPLLLAYDIKPIFLDVDLNTYEPPQEAYTDEVLGKSDAVLLVAQYGRIPDPGVSSYLRARGKTVIEDYAMRSPFLGDPLHANARIYSLPKTLPVPDGGLALLPQSADTAKQQPHRFSLAFIKNIIKLLPGAAIMIARARDWLAPERSSASWHGATVPSNMTKAMLVTQDEGTTSTLSGEHYTYCYPLRVSDPEAAAQRLRQRYIGAERVWHRPIVFHKEAQRHFKLRKEDYPNTMNIASEIVCAPLWHIRDNESYEKYVEKLEEMLADLLCK